jgi:hypothetical protein
MKADLFQLCDDKEWPEVRKYLSSDAAEEEKKSNIMYRDHNGWTCLHEAIYWEAPDDIVKAMIDIGGKELVMKTDNNDRTALHFVCNTVEYRKLSHRPLDLSHPSDISLPKRGVPPSAGYHLTNN